MTASMKSNPMVRRMQSSMLKNTVLLRRSGKAEDIAYAALFLASDESSYITGTDILVDGGWFSAAPYLTNERSHHMLSLMDKKERLEDFLRQFR
jgi:NAD(P)-dependent dehydrogenase (short-subunit alcohol dehydrogenase family)